MAYANGDLTAPLVNGVHDAVIEVNGFHDLGSKTASPDKNPFAFLGAPPLELPPVSAVNPFRNHTTSITGAYEWCKMVICLPIAAVRLALFGIAMAVGFLATVVALYGWKDKQSPMPRWRCRAMWITRFCARCVLFSFGYHWIKRKGRPAPREIAPIVACNHVSYIEPIYFFYELIPTMVSSESHNAIPFVGTIIKAMQVIYVDRFSPQSRKLAIHEIKRKASSNGFPRVMLFPEGTTTNGRFLISFQRGAFVPGLPVQPVVVRYPYIHFDQSWGNVSLLKLMFRMFTQFHNFMEVQYLPVIFPDHSKQPNVVNFAERVSMLIGCGNVPQTSNAMASALNVLPTSHSFGDMLLYSRASDQGKERCTNYMVEMAWVENSFNISTSEAVGLLDQFLAMDPDPNGRVQIHGLLATYGLGWSLSEKIFGFLDAEKRGSITFRQFLTGSALVRKQPSFWRVCEAAFAKCSGNLTDRISVEQIGGILDSVALDRSNEILYQLFDTDKDGIISEDDFTACLQKNPLLISLFASYEKNDQMAMP